MHFAEDVFVAMLQEARRHRCDMGAQVQRLVPAGCCLQCTQVMAAVQPMKTRRQSGGGQRRICNCVRLLDDDDADDHGGGDGEYLARSCCGCCSSRDLLLEIVLGT